MPRSGRLRGLIKEYNESPKVEKWSFIVPFLILFLELILLTYAIIEYEVLVIILTSILAVVSIVEIVLVTGEMHTQYLKSNFDRILTIRLDDFVTETKEKTSKK